MSDDAQLNPLTVFWLRLKSRLIPLGDLTAWTLLVLSVVPLLALSPSMIMTLVTWTAYGLALAGVSVMINRLLLPQVYLTEYLDEAKAGNVAAAIVVAAVLALLASVYLGLVLWAKA